MPSSRAKWPRIALDAQVVRLPQRLYQPSNSTHRRAELCALSGGAGAVLQGQPPLQARAAAAVRRDAYVVVGEVELTCSGGSGNVSRVSPLVAVTAAPLDGAGGGDLPKHNLNPDTLGSEVITGRSLQFLAAACDACFASPVQLMRQLVTLIMLSGMQDAQGRGGGTPHAWREEGEVQT
jgi:hypothetical protein